MTTNLLDRVGSAAFLAARRDREPRRAVSYLQTDRAACHRLRPGRLTTTRPESPVTETVHTTRDIEALIPHSLALPARRPDLRVRRGGAADRRDQGLLPRSSGYFPGCPFPGFPFSRGSSRRGARRRPCGLRAKAASASWNGSAFRRDRRLPFQRVVMPGTRSGSR